MTSLRSVVVSALNGLLVPLQELVLAYAQDRLEGRIVNGTRFCDQRAISNRVFVAANDQSLILCDAYFSVRLFGPETLLSPSSPECSNEALGLPSRVMLNIGWNTSYLLTTPDQATAFAVSNTHMFLALEGTGSTDYCVARAPLPSVAASKAITAQPPIELEFYENEDEEAPHQLLVDCAADELYVVSCHRIVVYALSGPDQLQRVRDCDFSHSHAFVSHATLCKGYLVFTTPHDGLRVVTGHGDFVRSIGSDVLKKPRELTTFGDSLVVRDRVVGGGVDAGAVAANTNDTVYVFDVDTGQLLSQFVFASPPRDSGIDWVMFRQRLYVADVWSTGSDYRVYQ